MKEKRTTYYQLGSGFCYNFCQLQLCPQLPLYPLQVQRHPEKYNVLIFHINLNNGIIIKLYISY